MDIFTPHEGMSNEKICQTQMELLEKKQNEYKLVGQMTAVPGHTLFKFNTETRVASKATMESKSNMSLNPQTGGIDIAKTSNVEIEKNCYYEQALNMKNFIKRLRRRGIIGAQEQIKTE